MADCSDSIESGPRLNLGGTRIEAGRCDAFKDGRSEGGIVNGDAASIESQCSCSWEDVTSGSIVEIQAGIAAEGDATRVGVVSREGEAAKIRENQGTGTAGGTRVGGGRNSATAGLAKGQRLGENSIAGAG